MILLIVNPVSGRQRGKAVLSTIIEAYSAEGLDVNVRFTTARGDARALAGSAKHDIYDKIICVGGDGTLNEVISGAIESGEGIPLGYIPLGSTNDFATSIKLPKELPAAIETTLHGDEHSLDIGDFGGLRNFAYIASFGAFTAASYSAPQSTKNAFGHLAYVFEGLKDIVNIKSTHMVIETDSGRYEDDYVFGAVANSTSIGGIVRLDSSLVDMSDGLFEVILIKNVKNPADLNTLFWSVMNSDYDNRMCDFFHSSSVTFRSESGMSWSLDGEEAVSGADIKITNLHNAIKILL